MNELIKSLLSCRKDGMDGWMDGWMDGLVKGKEWIVKKPGDGGMDFSFLQKMWCLSILYFRFSLFCVCMYVCMYVVKEL